MTKEERLSFRITPDQDKEIDQAVKENKEIRNRSHFGEKAIVFYLEHLKGRKTWSETVEQVLAGFALSIEKADLNYKVSEDEFLIALLNGEYHV